MSSLYLNHFDLAKPPFQITPDVDFFFSGSQRGGILTGLLHVASHEEGIVAVVAEVGSGKTLLSRLMLASLPADISTVYLSNPCFGRDEIISAIGRDMGLTTQVGSTEANLAQLHQELMRRYSLGKRVLLIIDEAHTMPGVARRSAAALQPRDGASQADQHHAVRATRARYLAGRPAVTPGARPCHTSLRAARHGGG